MSVHITDAMVAAAVGLLDEIKCDEVLPEEPFIHPEYVRWVLAAALEAAPPIEGYVWCAEHRDVMPLNVSGAPQCKRMAKCRGPFRPLIIAADAPLPADTDDQEHTDG